jgi:hypothetical protein
MITDTNQGSNSYELFYKQFLFEKQRLEEEQFKDENLILLILNRIIENKPFNTYDQHKLEQTVRNITVKNLLDSHEFKIQIKKFRQAIPNFLDEINNSLNTCEAMLTKLQKEIKERELKLRDLPEHAEINDNPNTIKFIKSLKKENYSFREAEQLLGKTRQTLTKYANEKMHGLKSIQHGRVKRLLKTDIINFYRLKNQNR